jgi:phage terminase small subunit
VKELNPKQSMFCKEYVVDFNGTQAAIRAGYSKKTANEIARKLLTKVDIQNEIQKLTKKRADRVEKTGDDVVRLLWKMAGLDLADYVSVVDGGEVQAIPFDQLPEGATKLISEIEEKSVIKESADGQTLTKFSNLKYKLPEKTKCLEMLGRHYGLFNDKLKLEVDNLPELIRSARERCQNKKNV